MKTTSRTVSSSDMESEPAPTVAITGLQVELPTRPNTQLHSQSKKTTWMPTPGYTVRQNKTQARPNTAVATTYQSPWETETSPSKSHTPNPHTQTNNTPPHLTTTQTSSCPHLTSPHPITTAITPLTTITLPLITTLTVRPTTSSHSNSPPSPAPGQSFNSKNSFLNLKSPCNSPFPLSHHCKINSTNKKPGLLNWVKPNANSKKNSAKWNFNSIVSPTSMSWGKGNSLSSTKHKSWKIKDSTHNSTILLKNSKESRLNAEISWAKTPKSEKSVNCSETTMLISLMKMTPWAKMLPPSGTNGMSQL